VVEIRNILARLQAGGDVATRSRAAAEIGADFSSGALSHDARAEAVAIFRTLLDDVEETVRSEMARALCRAADLPRDIAVALARDVLSVALPVLEWSEALTETDLVELVRRPIAGEESERDIESRLLAIAARRDVPERVVDALVAEGGEAVTLKVLANRGARFVEAAAHTAIDRFSGNPTVREALVERHGLPVSVVERLIFLVSDSLLDRLGERHNLSPRILSGVANQTRERAALDLIGEDPEGDRSVSLARGLGRRDRLSATVILRALCLAEFTFVEAALAERANLAFDGVSTRLRHGSKLDLLQIYRLSGLPEAVEKPMLGALHEAYRLLRDGVMTGGETFRRAMVETMAPFVAVGSVSPAGVKLGAGDLDFVLAQIGKGLAPPVDLAK
jgi:uncharacterized protein (DUF2336 family)